MNWIPRWSHYITRKPKALCRNHPRLLPEPCPSHGMPCQTVSCMRDTVRHGATRCSRHRARNGQESGTGRAPARIGYHNIIPHTGSTFRKDRDPACQKPDDHNFSCKNEQLSILLTRSTRGMFVLRFCMHVVRQSFLDTTTVRDGGMTASQNHTTSAGFIDEYGVCVCELFEHQTRQYHLNAGQCSHCRHVHFCFLQCPDAATKALGSHPQVLIATSMCEAHLQLTFARPLRTDASHGGTFFSERKFLYWFWALLPRRAICHGMRFLEMMFFILPTSILWNFLREADAMSQIEFKTTSRDKLPASAESPKQIQI